MRDDEACSCCDEHRAAVNAPRGLCGDCIDCGCDGAGCRAKCGEHGMVYAPAVCATCARIVEALLASCPFGVALREGQS